MLYIRTMKDVYPTQYESRLTLKDGKEVLLRPILQTDKHLIVDLLNKLSADTVYLRFLRPVTDLPEEMLFQLTHINYESNFALVAVIEENGKDSLIAVARYGYDSAEQATDFAIAVRDDWQHLGLGKYMLGKILGIGKEHGISRFVSIIDSANHNMKLLLRTIGYTVKYFHRGGTIQVEVLVAWKEGIAK
jgi:acetyltransferase